MRGFVSVDIETTGLDSGMCQIIQFGAVYDTGIGSIDSQQRIEFLVRHPRYVFDGPFAAVMNHGLFVRLKTIEENLKKGHPTEEYVDGLDGLVRRFDFWLRNQCRWDGFSKLTMAGKNYATFDRMFLRRSQKYRELPIHHRTLDPGSMFYDMRHDIEGPPSTEECMRRAGLVGTVKHEALDDALNVCQLIRAAWDCQNRDNH